MKRAVPAFLLLSAVFGCSRIDEGRSPGASSSLDASAGAPVFSALDFDDALVRARAEDKLVLVDVYTDWCTWCRKLDHDVFRDARVTAALKDVLPIRVNAEKGGGRSVADRYRVRGLPTLLFLNPDGNVVARSEGYISAESFLKLLEKLPGSRRISGRALFPFRCPRQEARRARRDFRDEQRVGLPAPGAVKARSPDSHTYERLG